MKVIIVFDKFLPNQENNVNNSLHQIADNSAKDRSKEWFRLTTLSNTFRSLFRSNNYNNNEIKTNDKTINVADNTLLSNSNNNNNNNSNNNNDGADINLDVVPALPLILPSQSSHVSGTQSSESSSSLSDVPIVSAPTMISASWGLTIFIESVTIFELKSTDFGDSINTASATSPVASVSLEDTLTRSNNDKTNIVTADNKNNNENNKVVSNMLKVIYKNSITLPLNDLSTISTDLSAESTLLDSKQMSGKKGEKSDNLKSNVSMLTVENSFVVNNGHVEIHMLNSIESK